MPSPFRFFIFFISTCLLAGCAIAYSEVILKTENAFYEQKYDESANAIRELTEKSRPQERLLFLMEAGAIFHYRGDFTSSNKALFEAEEIIEQLKKANKLGSFLINEASAEYRGEDFEVVLVRFYIALNFLLSGQYENAKIYLRKVNFDLKQMKYQSKLYKQNLLVRYLDAIVSEHLRKYNDARVQYKNIARFDQDFTDLESNRYALAVKEHDPDDIKKYSDHNIQAFSKKMKRKKFHSKMGELVVLYHSGKSPIKESRGKLLDDPYFSKVLQVSIVAAIKLQKAEGLSVAIVMGMVSGADNPVPLYRKRPGKTKPLELSINGVYAGQTYKLNDYEATALKNYNDNYKQIVDFNVTSLATKIVAAVAGSYLLGAGVEKSSGDRGAGTLAMLAGSASAGALIAATTTPDLRCWRLIPANYQVKRLYLEPGKYRLEVKTKGRLSPYPEEVVIEPGKPVFINIRGWLN